MAILNVRQLGDEILKKKCKPVHLITARTRQIIDDMYDTMYDAGGVGLAAPQVGILKRIVVIDVTPAPDPETGEEPEPMRYTMINPEILETSGEQRGYEGCLSYVGMSGIVTRPDHVKVRFTDENNDTYVLEGEGLLARAICHECDHLEGIMYTERVEGEVITNEQLDEILKEEAEKEKNGEGQQA